MTTATENRRAWLGVLKKRYKTWPALNEALGRSGRDATLPQIWTKAPNTGTGKPRQMGNGLAREIERRLGLPEGSLDSPPSAVRPREATAEEFVEIPVADPQGTFTPTPDDGSLTGEYVLIPLYDVRAAAGDGAINNEHEEPIEQLAYQRKWLHRSGFVRDQLVAAYAKGDSMAPRIMDGDTLLIDTRPVPIVDGAVYVFRVEDDLRCKRLVRRLDGAWIIRSDNQAPRYRDEVVTEEELRGLGLVGRVVHVAGGM